MTDDPPELPDTEIWIVDHVEDGVAVLVLDSVDGEPVVSEVAIDLLGEHPEPGAVLAVPLGSVGEPVWDRARPVTEE